MRLTILHTNDIHGRSNRIAQIATLVREERERAGHRVLYLDAGDVEETTNRLSNLTKGTAMHRLLALAGCDAVTVGNACWLRYGPTVLAEHVRVTPYPHLLANFAGVDGPVPSVLLGDVGVFGLTAPFDRFAHDLEWGFDRLDILETARRTARGLREQGADLVILLSHLGYRDPTEVWDDVRLVPELQDEVDVVIGAHSHDLLPNGEWIGRVLVTQAGAYGDQLGRIEIDGERLEATVVPVPEDTPSDPAIAAEEARIEAELELHLGERIGVIEAPLDARFIAEVLRVRMGADVGLFSEGQVLAVLPPGEVTRGALWDASESAANPGAARIPGSRLLELVARGNDPGFQAETPRPLRGRARGALAVVGPAIEPHREYVVGATDWELEPYGGYVLEEWGIEVRYDFPVIVREAVEEHLRTAAGY